MIKLKTKDDLLNKLRGYATYDDEGVKYKEKIRQNLLKCPELLYALHEKDLEPELFCENEDGELVLNIDEETGELLGEVDRYFGENANIRPYLFIPETQISFREAFLSQDIEIDVSDAVGRVVSRSTVGCPPAVPIVVSGEVISQEAIRCFEYYGINHCKVIVE